jgi:hypothetical protein
MTATEIWFSRVEGISTSYDTISACSECGSLVLDRNEAGHRVWHADLQKEAHDDNDT